MTNVRTALTLRVQTGALAIVRLDPDARVPAWTEGSRWLALVRTPTELSIVCEDRLVPPDVTAERNWTAFQVQGPLPLTMVGVLASISDALARASVSIFAVSSYDTDYILVRSGDLGRATDALRTAGHVVEPDPAGNAG